MHVLCTYTDTTHLLHTRNKLRFGDYIHKLLTLCTDQDFYLIVVDFMHYQQKFKTCHTQTQLYFIVIYSLVIINITMSVNVPLALQ